MLHCGDTLLMPLLVPQRLPHLWIIITEPGLDERCVIVCVTTLRNDRDQTVTLVPGDHPFIKHPSVILFADAQIARVISLEGQIAK